jgi:hypothetical protein
LKRFTLGFQIDCSVPIGRLDAGVAKPVTNRHEINAGA